MQEFQEKLNSVLSDPESMAQVMSMISTLAPLMQNMGNADNKENVKTNTDIDKNNDDKNVTNSLESPLPISSSNTEAFPASKMSVPVKLPKDRRCDLLEALKPYLKRSRAERVDQMIRILQISDILGIDTKKLFR